MFNKLMKQKKGVAGLNLFLSVIAMLFVIGIIIMAFALTGSRLAASTVSDVTANSVIQNTSAAISSATTWFPIFIVIAAIVVLILMIVLVIVSLRGAGLMGGGGMGA